MTATGSRSGATGRTSCCTGSGRSPSRRPTRRSRSCIRRCSGSPGPALARTGRGRASASDRAVDPAARGLARRRPARRRCAVASRDEIVAGPQRTRSRPLPGPEVVGAGASHEHVLLPEPHQHVRAAEPADHVSPPGPHQPVRPVRPDDRAPQDLPRSSRGRAAVPNVASRRSPCPRRSRRRPGTRSAVRAPAP